MDLQSLYTVLGPVPEESAQSLAMTIAEDVAQADIESFAADSRKIGRARHFDVVTKRKPRGPLDDADWEHEQVRRAARYLILRGRLAVVEHKGRTWVRILPRAEL
jgi:hypothetical protein